MNGRPILLVEDNPDDIILTLHALKANKVVNDVVVARDGEQALDYLFGTGAYAARNPGDLPAFVLLDLKLPKLDGFEVLRRVRGNRFTRLLPVVILTSSKEDPDRLKGYDAGCNSYIRKPVDFLKFTGALRQLQLYWLVLNEPPPELRS